MNVDKAKITYSFRSDHVDTVSEKSVLAMHRGVHTREYDPSQADLFAED